MLAPALVLSPVTMRPVPAVQAVLIASAAAVPSLEGLGRDFPILAVGDATAVALRASGFPAVTAAEGDAASLATLAARRLDPRAGPLLLPVGEGYGAELAAALRARGFRVIRRVAYAAREAPALPEPARDALTSGRVKAALFLSPRGATTCVRLFREAGLDERAGTIRALALSPRIGHALCALRWGSLEAAPRPRLDDLLAMLGPAAVGPAVG